MVEIKLPDKVKDLIEGSIFNIEDSVDDSQLARFLFYVPTVVKEYGLAIAELRRNKRSLEGKIMKLEGELEILEGSIVLDLDTSIYKNDTLRSARVASDEQVVDLKNKILALKREKLDVESDVDELTEMYWSFKTLKDSLESITKLRVSERSF